MGPMGQHWGVSRLQVRGGDAVEGKVNTTPYRYDAQLRNQEAGLGSNSGVSLLDLCRFFFVLRQVFKLSNMLLSCI